jgi:hypothetical protein
MAAGVGELQEKEGARAGAQRKEFKGEVSVQEEAGVRGEWAGQEGGEGRVLKGEGECA